MLAELKNNKFPHALPFRKLIGPSFIILGLGLGSGELILWPYLTSNYGMGIIWGAILGITFQFFMNMEIERYTLARGESVFVGFTRKFKHLPIWFLFSTFIPWVWPGIIAASAKVFGSVFGVADTHYVAIGLLIFIGLILSFGPILYKTVETLQKVLIGIGVPSVFLLSIYLVKSQHWADLFQGVVGIGKGYYFLPEGISIASFLAAFAYAGAGGNLNLAQSYYVKEKGYGMGKYAGRITSLFTGTKEKVMLTGSTFVCDKKNVSEFYKWWRAVNLEHFIIFLLTGMVTIVLLGLLSYTTTYGLSGTLQGINFLLYEGQQIGMRIFPAAGVFFLLVSGMTLFGTQLTVMDATSRIMSENIVLTSSDRLEAQHIPFIYYLVLWAQITAGILIFLFGFTEPLQLLTIAAVLNACAMFVHVGLTLWLNLTELDILLRPQVVRIAMMVSAFLFYGGFSLFVLYDQILKRLLIF